MKGKYHIIVEDKKVKYEFDIIRNITIIKGDSATGKTTLFEMIASYSEAGEGSGISLVCDVDILTIAGNRWKQQLSLIKGSIVFIDEGNAFLKSDEFADAIKNSDNYYVIITRDSLPNLPYSVKEIYGIRSSGRYAGLKQIYHEFYPLYSENNETYNGEVSVCVEDSNSGYDKKD